VTLGQFTASDGAIIPYRVKGDGPPLILIHGWSQSGAMFRHQLESLSSTHRVIVPDIRGHGESPPPKGGLRMSRLAMDLEELMAHFALERTCVLGWSMGVSVIWSYIDLFGTRKLHKLVLVDQPSMLTVLPGMSAQEIVECGALFTGQQLEDLCAGLRTEQGVDLRTGFVRGMVTKNIPPALLQWILDENAKTSTAVAAQLLWSHCTQDWRDVLRRIDRPTLVICGAVSHVDKRSQYYIQSQIPQAHICEFSAAQGGAHFPFLEAPESFNAAVARFL
jgi:pimeloyl-ACP methyl ester carboxylesterase